MNYTKLIQALKKHYCYYWHNIKIEGEKILLKLYYVDPLSNETKSVTYNIIKNKSYDEIVKKLNDTDVLDGYHNNLFDSIGLKITDVSENKKVTDNKHFTAMGLNVTDANENAIEIAPDIIKAGRFSYWKGFNSYYVMYDEKLISAHNHITKNFIYCDGNISKFLGTMNEEVLICVEDDKIVAYNYEGASADICYYPEPEDGNENHRKVIVNNDKIIVSVYVYYDCDLNHGEWEEEEYSLSTIKEYIEKKKVKLN